MIRILKLGHEGVPATELDQQQGLSDPTAQINQFLTSTVPNLLREEVHPWDTEEITCVQLAMAANAYANDLLAETLRANCVVDRSRRRGIEYLSPDAAYVGEILSQNSRHLTDDYVDGWQDPQRRLEYEYRGMLADYINDQGIDPDTGHRNVNVLDPVAQTVPFPLATPGERTGGWQRDDADAPAVTSAFMRSLVIAGRELQEQANSVLNQMTDHTQSLGDIPPRYAENRSVIEGIWGTALGRLDRVEKALYDYREKGEIPLSLRPEIYNLAYMGYIEMARTFVAAVAPAVLGPTFLPPRWYKVEMVQGNAVVELI